MSTSRCYMGKGRKKAVVLSHESDKSTLGAISSTAPCCLREDGQFSSVAGDSQQLWSLPWPFWQHYAQVSAQKSVPPHSLQKMLWSLPVNCALICPSWKRMMVCTMPLLGLVLYLSSTTSKLLLFWNHLGGRGERRNPGCCSVRITLAPLPFSSSLDFFLMRMLPQHPAQI